MIKFGTLKMDNGGDTMMHSAATCYQTTYNKLNKFFIVAQFFFKMPETLLGTDISLNLQEVKHCIHIQWLFCCDTG